MLGLLNNNMLSPVSPNSMLPRSHFRARRIRFRRCSVEPRTKQVVGHCSPWPIQFFDGPNDNSNLPNIVSHFGNRSPCLGTETGSIDPSAPGSVAADSRYQQSSTGPPMSKCFFGTRCCGGTEVEGRHMVRGTILAKRCQAAMSQNAASQRFLDWLANGNLANSKWR